MSKGNRRKLTNRFAFISVLLFTMLISACGSGAGGNGASSSASPADGQAAESGAPAELAKVTQVTNWFAEAEHGGQYTALDKGFYKEAGLDMTITPGGPQVSAVQIVASGKAEFGMDQADAILQAREQGIPIVAIAATFQKNPQVLIYHKEDSITGFGDLNGHQVFTASGSSYWEYIKKAYKLDKVKEMAYTGSLAMFMEDKTALTQGYVTSEPYALAKEGVDVGYLLIHDSGYQPYANVLFTTEDMIQNKPELVRKFVEASVKGWDYYKDHYEEMNPEIQKRNPDMTLEQMKYSAETQVDFVYGGDAATMGVGAMTAERWEKLADQMKDLGLISQDFDVSKAYTAEFLPGK
ncbi:ABC transporter substrate-binding protein [Paenibacillus thailandensis]|uniref:ABC transporter substrate-binding protein n=1 Tax=Paenibacillus thailandensis TaxID=393250 RepID=A0ABW5R0C7_9BACL